MDPNAALRDVRYLVEALLDEGPEDPESTAGIDLARLIESLDIWFSSGGFLPKNWAANR